MGNIGRRKTRGKPKVGLAKIQPEMEGGERGHIKFLK